MDEEEHVEPLCTYVVVTDDGVNDAGALMLMLATVAIGTS